MIIIASKEFCSQLSEAEKDALLAQFKGVFSHTSCNIFDRELTTGFFEDEELAAWLLSLPSEHHYESIVKGVFAPWLLRSDA